MIELPDFAWILRRFEVNGFLFPMCEAFAWLVEKVVCWRVVWGFIFIFLSVVVNVITADFILWLPCS